MHYIIFDLEFNQGVSDKEKNPLLNRSDKRCPFEIVQIGAYKLDERLRVLSVFDQLVKPTLYPTLHPFIKELTGISQEEVDAAWSFPEVLDEFIAFVGETENIFCVWGMGDIKELYRNIVLHGLLDKFDLEHYINIQKYTSKHFHLSRGQNIGLHSAIDFLKIPLKKSLHNAVNDAYYTAEIFKYLRIDKVKPKVYDKNQWIITTPRQSKQSKIDFDALIKQFEKMYERKLTKEEQAMVTLAYKMGKTNQFQVLTEEPPI